MLSMGMGMGMGMGIANCEKQHKNNKNNKNNKQQKYSVITEYDTCIKKCFDIEKTNDDGKMKRVHRMNMNELCKDDCTYDLMLFIKKNGYSIDALKKALGT